MQDEASALRRKAEVANVQLTQYPTAKRLRLCKPSTASSGAELRAVLPTDIGACQTDSLVWTWDFLPQGQRIGREGSNYFTLIQITGGPDTEADPGITNSRERSDYIHYAGLVRGSISRSQFRVRRNGEYLLINNDADLRAGDVLDFWGPSAPEDRTLFLAILPDGSVGFTRFLNQQDPSLSPEVEFIVRKPSISSTKRRLAMENSLWQTGEMGQQPTLQTGQSQPGCIGSLCRAAASGVRRFLQGARNFFSTDSSMEESASPPQTGNLRFVDDLTTFAGDRGSRTGRSRSRNSVSRKGSMQPLRTSNSRISSDPDRSRYDVSYEEEDSAEGGQSRIERARQRFQAPLPRITEATLEGGELDTPGLPNLESRLGLQTNAGTVGSLQGDTHRSEAVLSPQLVHHTLTRVVEEEAPEDEEDSFDNIGINLREVVTEEDLDSRTPYNDLYGVTFSSRSPGASRNLIELTRFPSTQGSQANQGQGASPAWGRFRRLNQITDFNGAEE
ncbi:hypothetical protein Dda_5332 [Drechslerella dactyloides]|uniref:Uncharacterized protein n=1 Tax=Drechslerella dactyloides TaxID=74499 RepID=A0AAD6IW04_DREDA|nr:hypothetical protein Dda_5332 [Drechslerella dactyloides]